MNYFIKSILLLIILINVNNCTSNMNNIQKVKEFNFIVPNNNTNNLYGYGQAFNLKEAKLLALENMSNRLIVQIESSITTNTSVKDNVYSKELLLNIKQSSKRIEFYNYKVLKNFIKNGTFNMLLSVNRIKLFKIYKDKFDLLHEYINNNYYFSYKYSKFEQINVLSKTKKYINEAKNYISILTALDSNFKYKKYLEFYEILKIKIKSLKLNLKINIISNNLKDDFFKNRVIQFLNNHDYKISEKFDVTIELKNNIIYSKYMRWYIVKNNTNIFIKNKHKILSTNVISSIGRSSTSKQNALISASNNFYKKLNNIGIKNLLFMNSKQ